MLDNDERLFLRVREVAKLLGVDYLTVINYIKRGIIKGKKLGHIWLIPKDWIYQKLDELRK